MKSGKSKKIIFLVSNDLATDNRMNRICNSLVENNFFVELVGRRLENSQALENTKFLPTRLTLLFKNNFLFYAELNIRLFFYLLINNFDIVCACDADTLPAAYFAGFIKGKKVVYDAHEYFSETPELIGRNFVQTIWRAIENFFIPKVDAAYTVNDSLAQIFEKKYNKKFEVIRNLPLKSTALQPKKSAPFILYQGAVNMGRGVKEMLLAMQYIEGIPFYIVGGGDEFDKIQSLIKHYKLEDKVKLLGKKTPKELREITHQAYIGINLLEQRGLNYYFSLSNKFFDYIQVGVPQVCIAFPEYIKYNEKYKVAVMVEGMIIEDIVSAINKLLKNNTLYETLQRNCLHAAQELNWENE
jgi:glycosyltransferase involved in cell wall biosynthesis